MESSSNGRLVEPEWFTEQQEYLSSYEPDLEPESNDNGHRARSNGHKARTSSKAKNNGHHEVRSNGDDDGLRTGKQKKTKDEIIVALKERGDLPVVLESALDVVNRPLEPTEWIIEDILPKVGQFLVAASQKTGKSLTFLEIVKELAKTIEGTIVVFSLEDDANLINLRLRELLDGDGGNWLERIKFVWQTGAKIENGLQEQFEDVLKQYPDCYLIITDTYAQVRVARKGNDVFLGDYGPLSPLKKFANDRKICSIIIHHTNKRPKDSDNPFARVSGSVGLGAAVDGEWVMDRPFRSKTITVSMQGRRYTEDTQVTYQIGQFWETVKVEKEQPEEDPATTKQKIMALLQRTSSGFSSKRIAEVLKLKRNTVRSALSRMHTKSAVWQAPFGDYYESEAVYNLLLQQDATGHATGHEPASQADIATAVAKNNNSAYVQHATDTAKSASQADVTPVAPLLQPCFCNRGCNRVVTGVEPASQADVALAVTKNKNSGYVQHATDTAESASQDDLDPVTTPVTTLLHMNGCNRDILHDIVTIAHEPATEDASHPVANSVASTLQTPVATVVTLPISSPVPIENPEPHKLKVIPHCKHFLCMLGPNRTQWKPGGYYCPSHRGWIDEEGRPL